MVVNGLEEHSGCVFTGRQMMEPVWPNQNFGTRRSDYTVP